MLNGLRSQQHHDEGDGQQQAKRQRQLRDITGMEHNSDSSHLLGDGKLNQTRAPSNFAGFAGRQQEQLPPGGDPQASQLRRAASGPAVPTQPVLPTFADLSTRGGPASRSNSMAAQVNAMQTLSFAFGNRTASSTLPTLLGGADSGFSVGGAAGSREGGAESTAAAAGSGRPPLAVVELSVAVPPFDWGLKTSLQLASGHPFASVQAAVRSQPHQVHAAHSAFLSGRTHTLTQPEERLHAALCSWRHPDSSLPSAAIAALCSTSAASGSGRGGPAAGPTSRGGGGAMSQRRIAWGRAFFGAYDAVRRGQCHALYVCSHPVATAEGAPRPGHVALFCAAGVRGCPVAHAVLTHSTKAFRARLTAAGVEFAMPAAAALGNGWAEYKADIPDQLPSSSRPAMTAKGAGKAGPAASAVMVLGWRAMHALFDALRAEHCGPTADALGGAGDVPTLLAPVHFAGASLHKPTLRVLGVLSTGAPQHKVEVVGLLPPWTTHRLLATLADAQPGRDVSMLAMQPEPACAGGALNLEADAAPRPAAAAGAAADSRAEAFASSRQPQQRQSTPGGASGSGGDLWAVPATEATPPPPSAPPLVEGDAGALGGNELGRWSELDPRLRLLCVKRMACRPDGQCVLTVGQGGVGQVNDHL